jgi:hypothetical protein
MELKRDLLTKDRYSKLRIIIGILFLGIALTWITQKITGNLVITPFDWLYTAVMFLNGLFHTLFGLGFSIGKAYVLVNEDRISIKPDIMKKEQTIHWESIKTLEYKLNKYLIHHIDNTQSTLDLSKIDYLLKNEIKDAIEFIAREKNIVLS